MSWLLFALLSTVSFSAAGLLDKLVLSERSGDPKAYIVCQILIQQIFTVPVFILANISFTYPQSLLAAALGSLELIPAIYYLRAVQEEEISRVTALEYLYILFVFIGAGLFLGESLDMRHYLGGAFILISVILISYRSGGPSSLSAISPAIRHFYFFWILTAAHYLALKYLLGSMDELSLYAWSMAGCLITIMPLLALKEIRIETSAFLLGNGKFTLGAIIVEEAFQFMGLIFSIYAYTSGSATQVTTVSALQPLMTLISAIALSVFKPGLLDEELGRNTLIQKMASVLFVAVGIYFIY